ncbi:MAG: hypothetical protein IPG80_06830 [Anaerolineales bacterium]|uniref:hypothetical protein n=1 Tax=Candidatus Villigracilis vicinus TaxID=3140679 RepID=UPI003134A1B0|nr:hypothetical protein [Anaerolineales bacterium]
MQFRLSPTARQTFLIAIITVIAYGLLLPLTGFYWDDWPFAWIAKFLGPAEFIPAFMPFRPFLGPIFYFTTSLVPPVPLYWQIFALIIRFLIGIAAWWMFNQILPTRKTLAFFAALLMLVFPGYSQHWVAYTHINQELIPFLFYLLSFGYTFKALRTQTRTDTVIALLLQICGIFPTEYFFGIEGIRFLLLFTILQGSLTERFARSFKLWLPYLFIWILNAAWLFYYYKFGPYESYEVTATQSPDFMYFLVQALDALWKAGFYIWTQILVLTFSTLPAPASLLTLGLIALSFIFLIRILLHSAPPEVTDNTFAISLLISSIFAILLGRLPSLAAGLPLTLQSSFDRFMISMMFGACMFVIGLLELLVKNHRTRVIIFSALIALGIGQQFFNANIFRRDWQRQGDIYWQMAWRIPALEKNTVLLAYEIPIDYETDLSFTAPINWMYAPDYTRSDLPYILLYTKRRLGGFTIPSLEKDVQINYPYRTVNFSSSTSNALTLYMPEHGCLRVFDPARGDLTIYSHLPEEITNAIPISDPARIITDAPQPAQPMFFAEPKPEWCYFYAKAGLANQQGDFETSARLGDEVFASGFKPEDAREWLVFVEAYAMNGEFDQASKASESALEMDEKTLKAVCTVWEQIQAKAPAGSENAINSARLKLGCNP